jgi:hypothetical protein
MPILKQSSILCRRKNKKKVSSNNTPEVSKHIKLMEKKYSDYIPEVSKYTKLLGRKFLQTILLK